MNTTLVIHRVVWAFAILYLCAATIPHAAHAHEGHDDLPSTGVAVRGNRLIISPEAEKTLGLTTTVLHLQRPGTGHHG